MLNLKEKVVYGTTGVCVVDSIEEKKIGKEVKQYYVLKPVSQATSTVFVPADSEKLLAKVHPILTEEELNACVDSISSEQDVWVENDADRRVFFSEVISSGDRKKCLLMMRSLYNRRLHLSSIGRRLHISDERAFKEVQRLIFDEFSVVLCLKRDEVDSYLKEKLSK